MTVVASGCVLLVTMFSTAMRSYEKDHARRSGLILGALSVEQDTLASLLSPSRIVVGNVSLFRLNVGIESLPRDWLLAEPEKVLHKSKLSIAVSM